MRAPHPAAGLPLTWAVATLLLVAFDLLVMRTPLVWGKATLWVHDPAERIHRLAFWQAYDVARTLYRPRPAAAERVAILGNSLVWFPAQPAYVERELRRRQPDIDVRVDNLSFFGAHIGDIEIVARELPRLDPTVVVLALGGSELVDTKALRLVNPPGRLLERGWQDGPVPPAGPAERIDRWIRSAWPTYRFRQFVRDGLADRLWPAPADERIPEQFASTREVFAFLDADRAAVADDAFATFRQRPDLDTYIKYLRARWIPPEPFDPLPEPHTLTPESPGVAVLDHLLAQLAAGPWRTIVLLMPENPLLDADRDGRFHRSGFSAHAAALIRTVAERRGVRVVDARRWMPPEAFLDFVHLFPDISGFQVPLAEEILRDRPS